MADLRARAVASDVPAPSAVLPRASALDTARVLAGVVAPVVAKGVIARRRRAVGLVGKLDTDGRAVRILQRLRERYGSGPLQLRVPLRPAAVVLSAPDVQRVLEGSPEPFAPALRQFQPHGSLALPPELRADRRRFTESILDTGRPLHRCAQHVTEVMEQEIGRLSLAADGVLDWDGFTTVWWRVIRRVVLGDGARDDHELTDELTTLRRGLHNSWLHPRSARRVARLRAGLRGHVRRADSGSLAHLVATTPPARASDPIDQVPRWLFAFDLAGAATLRALALLVSHPDELASAQSEIDLPAGQPHERDRLRATVLESVRLWPITPLLLRNTTTVTEWTGGRLVAGTAVLIPTWFFHRDDRTRDDADRFDPQLWLVGARTEPALVPFGAGPAACPGRELVLFTASTFLAVLLRGRTITLAAPSTFGPHRPLPRGLDPFGLRFLMG